MTRYSQPHHPFDFFHSPSALDAKAAFPADDEINVLDDKILDSNPDLSTMADPRRPSFDQSPDDFSRRDSVWTDISRQSSDAQSRHASQLSTPIFESAHNPFVRLDTAQPASFGQQPSWSLPPDSGSCTPTPIYEFPHDFDGNPSTTFTGGAVGPVHPMPFPQMPFRTGSTFPPSNAIPMSPQSSQGWVSTSSEVPESRVKPTRNPTYRNGSPLHVRRDGIRKKNARFEIPAERTLSNIDMLINRSKDEDEIKELKQQKRLLRNRQAALDSRQRKKVHTEQLEEDKKRSSSLINELQEALQEMKLREAELHREKTELFERQEQLHRYIEQLHMEKEEMIRTHTLETGELRKKNSILREHLEKMETTTRSSATTSTFRNEFSDFENLTMDNSPWEDFSMVNEFSLDVEPQPVSRTPTPAHDPSLLMGPKKSDKPSEKLVAQTEFPFSWNAFYMCLLFGAFIASNSTSLSTPTIPEEYRAESANVLKAVLASANPSESLQPVNPGSLPAPSSAAPAALPTTISSADMAQMTSVPRMASALDDLHNTLVAPTKEQEDQQVFALTADQYNSLTTLEDGEANFKPPQSNLQQAYAAMRSNGMQHRADAKNPPDIYSRSLLWDRVPEKVVRDFRRMVRECGATAIKEEETGGGGC